MTKKVFLSFCSMMRNQPKQNISLKLIREKVIIHSIYVYETYNSKREEETVSLFPKLRERR